jgi:hypothetical protein
MDRRKLPRWLPYLAPIGWGFQGVSILLDGLQLWHLGPPTYALFGTGLIFSILGAWALWRSCDDEVAALTEERDSLLEQLDTRGRREAARIATNAVMASGQGIRTRLLRDPATIDSGAARQEVHEWVQSAQAYVARTFTGYEAHFLSDGGFGMPGVIAGPGWRSNLVIHMDRRLARLGALLDTDPAPNWSPESVTS